MFFGDLRFLPGGNTENKRGWDSIPSPLRGDVCRRIEERQQRRSTVPAADLQGSQLQLVSRRSAFSLSNVRRSVRFFPDGRHVLGCTRRRVNSACVHMCTCTCAHTPPRASVTEGSVRLINALTQTGTWKQSSPPAAPVPCTPRPACLPACLRVCMCVCLHSVHPYTARSERGGGGPRGGRVQQEAQMGP